MVSEVLNYASVASVMRYDNSLIATGTFLYSEVERDYFTIYRLSGSYIISLHGDYTLKPLDNNKYEIRMGE